PLRSRPCVLGRAAGRDRARHCRRRPVRALPGALPPLDAAARPWRAAGGVAAREQAGPRAPPLLRRDLGQLALAAALRPLLLAVLHEPSRPAAAVLRARRRTGG